MIDERGRLFGRLNIVDAAIGALVLLLLPAAYGAYVLFRAPVPKLTAVNPPTLKQGPNLQVEIRGGDKLRELRVDLRDAAHHSYIPTAPE